MDYPNIYEVKTYKQQNNRWVLKTPSEIKSTIKTYLIGKADEYNTLLSAQLNKKNQYYQAFKNQFITLGQADTRANPNNHSYDILPSEYFVDRLIEYLDTLEETYGTHYIYGNQTPDTDDEKIDMLAKFLYQQNNPRPERTITTNVEDDISEIKSSFDINQKINNVVHTYLTKDNDQGKFLTPTYNQTGYEVGFINSDGEDYVSAKEAPSFIQKIQEYQTKETAPLAANAFIEDETQTNSLQQSVNTCE